MKITVFIVRMVRCDLHQPQVQEGGGMFCVTTLWGVFKINLIIFGQIKDEKNHSTQEIKIKLVYTLLNLHFYSI